MLCWAGAWRKSGSNNKITISSAVFAPRSLVKLVLDWNLIPFLHMRHTVRFFMTVRGIPTQSNKSIIKHICVKMQLGLLETGFLVRRYFNNCSDICGGKIELLCGIWRVCSFLFDGPVLSYTWRSYSHIKKVEVSKLQTVIICFLARVLGH